MRVMHNCAKLSKKIIVNFAYVPQLFSFVLKLLRLLGLIKLDKQILMVLYYYIPYKSNSWNKNQKIY